MSKKLSKIAVSTLTSIFLVLSNCTPVFAYSSTGSVREDISNEVKVGEDEAQNKVSEYNTVESEESLATNVFATLSSTFDVTIPKTVILDGSTFLGEYTVDVNGDISANEFVEVVPDTSFPMNSMGKESITAIVSQDKVNWLYNEMDINAKGIITADGFTAGSWNGTFNFIINMKSENHEHTYTEAVTKAATCTEDGIKTFTCECGDSYTEVITATGHSYENGKCVNCGEADPDYVLEAGLYDSNGVLLCTWEESGIDDTCSNAGNIINYTYPTATKVIISDSVTSIGDWAFEACTNLTSIIIPDSVSSIRTGAFAETGLVSVTIPDSVSSIGDSAFCYCTSLTSITIPNSVTSIDASAFTSCTSLTNVEIPDSVTIIRQGTFYGCTGLISVTIPDSVTSIGSNAFYECTNLSSIIIPNSVASIRYSAFYECTNLSSIIIPDSVTSIENYAFYNTNLTSATFKNTSGWYIGGSEGAKTTALSSSDLTDASTAATYLKSTYSEKYWTRSE